MQRTIVQPLKLDLSAPQLTQDDGQVSSSGDGNPSVEEVTKADRIQTIWNRDKRFTKKITGFNL